MRTRLIGARPDPLGVYGVPSSRRAGGGVGSAGGEGSPPGAGGEVTVLRCDTPAWPGGEFIIV
ncbi:hypothetical protein [Spongiactinospora gelatinilytica]|uniref:hypothetical protein n=1 Tax=Spongiactinospora gelatinilytica TaxID=2666298 RepID=UPI0011B947F6|nr:hypothetical protein [Spongiactinospora gelatinilytica]